VPPTSPVEKKIAEIGQHVLEADRVGLLDNFFDMGGHSLMAIKAISLIEKEFGAHMPFREFFNQTLGQFSASCEEKLSSKEYEYANRQH
jgi:acyl carrier protein